VDFDRFNPVVATRWIVTTDPMPTARQLQPRGNGDLVKTNQLGKNPGHAGALKFKTQNSTLKEELRSRERNLGRNDQILAGIAATRILR
jgi:hypothetical protein